MAGRADEADAMAKVVEPPKLAPPTATAVVTITALPTAAVTAGVLSNTFTPDSVATISTAMLTGNEGGGGRGADAGIIDRP